MKKVFLLALCATVFLGFKKKSPDKVLIFSLTKGYHHASIADGITAIQKIGETDNFSVDTTTNPAMFTDANLKQYKALIFLSPTGNALLNADQQKAFVNYIHKGGGFVGIHAATDCLYDWDWYGKLVGAYFTKHPKIQPANLNIIDTKHPSTKMLPQTWQHTDEWYNFKQVSPDINVLMKIDETSYTGGEMNGNHPMAWYQKFEGGRVFYTALGHTKEDFTTDNLFLQHLTGGINYALNR
ncbi:ThuA domain-containing protein [Mucilaginibacter mali]|uniref:ThuA domain-containing protein n=2 Tax=Mucilaginibacter mali TaxID=2740462 RepID=A0A7D4UPG4_9SPHI|nr:ThuA domain-containing protein [Mucilaginibacter mali]